MLVRHLLPAILLAGFVGCADSVDEDNALDDSVRKVIDDFNQRTIYKTLDPEILAGIADNDLEQAVVDYVAAKLEGHHMQEVEILATIPKGARALWLTWVVEGEVNNGGFNQYFFNSGGHFAAEAVKAFQYFSASQHASLLKEANLIRAREAKAMQKYEEKGTLEAFSESYEESKLGPLDARFYALKEDLSELRKAKIRSAPELFSGN